MKETTGDNMNSQTIEDILDECLDELISGTSSIEQCLARYPEHSVELRSLLETAIILKQSPEMTPSTGARQRVRYALNERMAEMAKKKKAGRPFFRLGLANIMVSLILSITLIGGGLAYAASGAMPDQTLYSLKIGLEKVMLSLAPGEDARISLYTSFNDRRVEEIIYLAGKGNSLAIAEITSRIADGFSQIETARRYSENDLQAEPPGFATTANGSDDPDRLNGNKDNLSSLLTEAQTSQLAILSDIPAGASPAVQKALEQAATVLREGYSALVDD
ncbi:conserved hypothetical protein [Dehalogenimonas lykanthroporepellens BL-DC-9]|nr:conserved hypothetical protein [Dehalogenimonas lykanthroporepellens BL-DC-9]